MPQQKTIKPKRSLLHQFLTDNNDIRRIYTLARLDGMDPGELENKFLNLCLEYQDFITEKLKDIGLKNTFHESLTVIVLKAGIHFVTLQIRITHRKD